MLRPLKKKCFSHVHDDVCPKCPNMSTHENVRALQKVVMEIRRIIIKKFAEDVCGISVASCHAILSEVLGMKHVLAKFVSKLLNFNEKYRHVCIAQELLNNVNDDPDFFKKIIIGDNTWVYSYDVETKTSIESPMKAARK